MFELRLSPCSVTKPDWEKDKNNFKTCVNSINVYHCIQDEKNRSGEICIQPVWVQPHYCPEFNTGHWALDTIPCNATKGCPNVTFLSNEVYQYPVCLNKTHRKEFSVHGEYSLHWLWIAVPILLGIAVLALATTFFVRGQKRKRQDNEGNNHPSLLEDNGPFHQTAAFHEAKQYLEHGGKFLVLSGIWGSGKSKIAMEVYRSVTGRSPKIIRNLEKFNFEGENQPLIFDEVISGSLSNEKMKNLQDSIKLWLENDSESVAEKPRLATVSKGKKPWFGKVSYGRRSGIHNTSIAEDSLLEKESNGKTKKFIIFTSNGEMKSTFALITSVSIKELKVINLNNSLTKGDRIQILHSHFAISHPNKNFSKIEDLAKKGKNESLGYPEISALFCRCDDFQKQEYFNFFEVPLRSLKAYFRKMYHSETNKFLMLVYMSLNQMEVDVKNLDEMLYHELETCRNYNHTQAELSVDTKIEIVQHGEIDSENIKSLLSWEFVNKVPNSSKYRLQHDVIKRMTLIVFGAFHFGKLLELSEPEDLKGWIKEKAVGTKVKNAVVDIMPSLNIDRDKWKQYKEKMGWKTAGKS